MRKGTAVVIAAVAAAASACGPRSQPAVVGPSTSAAGKVAPTIAAATGWVRVVDPSGIRFMFPAGTAPTLSGSSTGTTRTYLANAGAGVVASIVIVPTPVKLNTKNFITKYPLTLATQGDTHITAGAVSTVMLGGFEGHAAEVRYDSSPGPTHFLEKREAVQLSKYFVVISAIVQDNRPLTAAEIARARAVHARLLAGFGR